MGAHAAPPRAAFPALPRAPALDARDLGGTQSQKEVGFGHFEGLYLGTILLKLAETFTDPCSAHGSLREFLKNPEDGCIQDMLK